MNFGDRLVSIEALDFALPGGGTETLDLAVFLAVLEAEAGELRDATLAYVALLDRLPDALGLYYWAGQPAGGADLGAIAARWSTWPTSASSGARRTRGARASGRRRSRPAASPPGRSCGSSPWAPCGATAPTPGRCRTRSTSASPSPRSRA
jgi:hypothetical protein